MVLTCGASSYKALREEALEAERWNRLHPEEPERTPLIREAMNGSEGQVIAASDWIKAVPDQISRWAQGPFTVLGTEGFGRSDTRESLRKFFEIDAEHIVIAAPSALGSAGEAKPERGTEAIERDGIDTDRPDPRLNEPNS